MTAKPLYPSPNVLAFDRAAVQLRSFADVLRDAPIERQTETVRHIVERVTMEGGQVRDITVRLEARPFFAEMLGGLVVAPPDGLEPRISELLEAYG